MIDDESRTQEMARGVPLLEKTRRPDGFAGQIMHVLPRPLLAREARHFPVRELYVTDLGWYPRAAGHGRRRDEGAGEHILILCEAGEGLYQVQGREGRLGAGEALLIPRGAAHAYGASDRDPWSIHWVHFLGDDADYYLRLLPDGECRLPVAAGTMGRMIEVFRGACASLDRGLSGSVLCYLSHALRHLLGLLFFENRSYDAAARGPSRHDVAGWIDGMLDRIGRPFSLAAMARRAGLSVPQFSAVFRRQTGMTPVNYFIHLKVQRACALLDVEGLAIAEVARAVGYDDPYYFSRIFRKVMGVSPRDFRKQRFG
ncbi:AraC family transcriptional regulator [Aquisphaera insulae]|uniref:AraC family transcriptional regulator n=1 Tax=Aquisphaera insulae TaxID=2712864 RepID=UPI0013EA5495|nr:AraC family transcriptional regulator [Aquisphaera insulae]